MISQAPGGGTAECALPLRVRIALKVPNTSWCSYYELDTTDDKGVDPEQCKHLVNENASSCFVPFYFCYELITFPRFWSANRKYENCGRKPENKPQSRQYCWNSRQDEDTHVWLNILSSSFKYCNTNLNCIVAANQRQKECSTECPKDVSGIGKVPVNWILSVVLLPCIEVGIEAATE